MREDRLDDATLDELARLHEAATDAPWAWEMTGDKDNSWGVGLVIDDNDEPVAGRNEPGEGLLVEPICDGSNHPPDAELIATVRNALPSLLAEVRAARLAIEGCGCPAPYDACTHDEPLTKTIERLTQQLADRQIVLDQNEAYFAELTRLRATETAARALLDAVDGPDGSVLIDDLGISTIQAAREALRAALSAASTEPDRAMLNVLCECGHRAGRHGAGGILGSKCYEHVDVEQWCPCERFISTGVMAAAPGPEGSDHA